MSMFDDDIATMFADQLITVPVNYDAAGTSARGILSRVDELTPDPSGGYANTSAMKLQILAGALGTIPNDGSATVTIDGVDYRVRDIRHDGPHFQNLILA